MCSSSREFEFRLLGSKKIELESHMLAEIDGQIREIEDGESILAADVVNLIYYPQRRRKMMMKILLLDHYYSLIIIIIIRWRPKGKRRVKK